MNFEKLKSYADCEKITVEEAEARHAGWPKIPGMEKPFKFANERWEELKTAMQPGDELYAFNSPMSAWRALAGRKGVALVRDGQVVTGIITMLN